MKLDVEGAELHALTGAREILARSPNAWVVFEFGPSFYQDEGKQLLDFAKSLSRSGLGMIDVDGRLTDFQRVAPGAIEMVAFQVA